MHVIAPEETDVRTIPSHKLVDTTIASDWRYRENKWRRRCRIVAREFKSDNTDENSFAPTTTFGAVRILLVLSMVFNLMLTGIDVKDAFLCVEQQEEMFVVIPQWIRDLSPEDKSTVWRLKRCLPGQRNAALRWFEYFSNLCQSVGMESYKGCPTIMKLVDGESRVYLSVHVDDVLLVGNEKDLEWFKKEVASGLTIKVDGPHAQGSGDIMFYLKKRITLLPEGILVQPNGTYIPKLINMLKISGRRKKGLPHHAVLETYNSEFPEQDVLTGEEASLFRSALGLILYFSHDRPDISFATKTLATWMSYPCMKAMAALKHLALYLSGTEHAGVMLRKCETYEDVFDRWIEADEWSDVTREQRKDRAVFNFDIFSDSSWGDDLSTRRSTSSCVMFVNGAYISSFSRTQATVALSSCEAELYAANAVIAEGLFLVRVCKFLCGDQKDENSGEVKVKLHID